MPPFMLGILAASGAAPAGNPAFDLLTSTTLPSDTSSVTFDNLSTSYSADYEHLQFRVLAGTTQSAGSALYSNIIVEMNDATEDFAMYHLQSTSSNVSSDGKFDKEKYILDIPGTGNSSGHFSAHIIDIVDAFSSVKKTTMRGYGGRLQSNVIKFYGGFWNQTDALTKIKFDIAQSANFKAGSTFALYGLRKQAA